MMEFGPLRAIWASVSVNWARPSAAACTLPRSPPWRTSAAGPPCCAMLGLKCGPMDVHPGAWPGVTRIAHRVKQPCGVNRVKYLGPVSGGAFIGANKHVDHILRVSGRHHWAVPVGEVTEGVDVEPVGPPRGEAGDAAHHGGAAAAAQGPPPQCPAHCHIESGERCGYSGAMCYQGTYSSA